MPLCFFLKQGIRRFRRASTISSGDPDFNPKQKIIDKQMASTLARNASCIFILRIDAKIAFLTSSFKAIDKKG